MRSRLEVLADQLRVDVLKTQPQPGSLLLIRPGKEGDIFPDQYCNWIADCLGRYLPLGASAIILANGGDLVVSVEPPAGVSDEYLEGWKAAVKAVMEVNTQ